MRLLVFGLSITSSWGNGHATVYRGLLKALHRQGVDVTFVERDVPWYADNRDLAWCDFARIVLYHEEDQLRQLLGDESDQADMALVGSYFPHGMEVVDYLSHRDLALLYYDIDTPVTLAALAARGTTNYLRADQIPLFDAVLSFTGGRALAELGQRWGARSAVALYCGLDPETHRRTDLSEQFRARLSYMGTYSLDRHDRWESLFVKPSLRLPDQRFVLAGPQYPDLELPVNVRHFQHLSPPEHSPFYSSSDVTLNITRGPMVAYGYSPSVRLFEAAGCGACIVSDRWDGLGEVFEVGREVLVAGDDDEMVRLLGRLGPDEIGKIGERALARALREHTYDLRARQFLDLVDRL